MAKADNKRLTYIDFTPIHAKDEKLRPQLEESLKEQLVNDVPAMVSRLAKLEQLITVELDEYTDLLVEARLAFQYGLWRGVVALIGITAEKFTDSIYSQIKQVRSLDGEEIDKKRIFGDDAHVPEKRKLEILRFFGLITSPSFDKLIKIKKLRDKYVHPPSEELDVERDARKAMTLFQAVLKERFDAKYTIKKGKIVEREG